MVYKAKTSDETCCPRHGCCVILASSLPPSPSLNLLAAFLICTAYFCEPRRIPYVLMHTRKGRRKYRAVPGSFRASVLTLRSWCFESHCLVPSCAKLRCCHGHCRSAAHLSATRAVNKQTVSKLPLYIKTLFVAVVSNGVEVLLNAADFVRLAQMVEPTSTRGDFILLCSG